MYNIERKAKILELRKQARRLSIKPHEKASLLDKRMKRSMMGR